MAKGKKDKSGKGGDAAAASEKAVARGLRKHLRELERRLVDAAKTELKRVRKLERARNRRQQVQAAVDALRSESGIATKAAAATTAAAAPAPKAAAPKAAAPKAAAPKPAATPRTAATRKPAAARPAASKPAPKAPPKPAAPATDA